LSSWQDENGNVFNGLFKVYCSIRTTFLIQDFFYLLYFFPFFAFDLPF